MQDMQLPLFTKRRVAPHARTDDVRPKPAIQAPFQGQLIYGTCTLCLQDIARAGLTLMILVTVCTCPLPTHARGQRAYGQ